MTRKLLPLLMASAAIAAPLAAQAQDSATVNITATVDRACVIGQPSNVTLGLGVLTGPDGRIRAELAGAAPSATTEIQTAWCNTPSTLSLNADPMGLTTVPAYSTPAGFARLITYDADLTGWPSALLDRPVLNSPAVTADIGGAHSAPLTLEISALAALDAAGALENPTAILEAGQYAGSVVVSVSVP